MIERVNSVKELLLFFFLCISIIPVLAIWIALFGDVESEYDEIF